MDALAIDLQVILTSQNGKGKASDSSANKVSGSNDNRSNDNKVSGSNDNRSNDNRESFLTVQQKVDDQKTQPVVAKIDVKDNPSPGVDDNPSPAQEEDWLKAAESFSPPPGINPEIIQNMLVGFQENPAVNLTVSNPENSGDVSAANTLESAAEIPGVQENPAVNLTVSNPENSGNVSAANILESTAGIPEPAGAPEKDATTVLSMEIPAGRNIPTENIPAALPDKSAGQQGNNQQAAAPEGNNQQAAAPEGNNQQTAAPERAEAVQAKPAILFQPAAQPVVDPALEIGKSPSQLSITPNDNNALSAHGRDNSSAALSTKDNNTVSMTMGEQFKKLLGIMEQNKTGLRMIYDPTPLRQTHAAQEPAAGSQGQATAASGVVQEMAEQLFMGNNSNDGSASQQSPAKAGAFGLFAAAGTNATGESFIMETGAAVRPQTAQTPLSPDTATVRLPSGTFVSENQVVNHVIERLSLYTRPHSATSNITIKMHPEELGELRLRLEVTNDGVKVRLLAQTQQAQEILERHAPRLREALAQQGLKLDDIRVSVDSGQEEGKAPSQQGHWAQSGHNRRPDAPNQPAAELADDIDNDQIVVPRQGLADGRISLRV